MDNIDTIISNLSFTAETVYKDGRSTGLYYYAAGFIDKKNVFVKIISKKDFAKRCEFHYKREIYAQEIFAKANKTQNIEIPLLNVIDSGETEKYLWIVREYKKIEPFCVSDKNFYDLNPKVINNLSQIVPNICHTMKDINRIAVSDFSQKFFSRFLNEISQKSISECEALGIKMEKISEVFNTQKLDYFTRKGVCLGDLNPRNILIGNDGGVVFFDFEWISVDNPIVDLAFLWYFLHRNKELQKMLIEEYELSDQGKTDFQISLIRVILSVDDGLYKSDSKDAALKYLIAAGESFEAIMNVK